MNELMNTVSPELVLVDPELAASARALLPPPADCLARRAQVETRPSAARSSPVDGNGADRERRRSGSARSGKVGSKRVVAVRLIRGAAAFAAWAAVAALVASPLLAFIPPSQSVRPKLLPLVVEPSTGVQPGSESPAVGSNLAVGPLAGSDEPLAESQSVSGSTDEPVLSDEGVNGETFPSKRPTVTGPTATSSLPDSGESVAAPMPSGRSAEKTDRTKRDAPEVGSPAARGPETSSILRWRVVPDAVVYNVIFVRNGERVDVWPTVNHFDIVPSNAGSKQQGRNVTYQWFVYAGFRRNRQLHYGALVAHGAVRVPRGAVKPGRPPERVAPS